MERHDDQAPAAAAENPFESTFDDDFAVHTPDPSVYEFSTAAGSREQPETSPNSRLRPSGEFTPRRSISLDSRPEAKRPTPQPSQPLPARSSIAKQPLPTDQSRGPAPNRASRVISEATPRQSSDYLRRSSSRASSYAPYEPSGTPSLTGPSHPYGMYPQTGVPRSASTTTASTARRAPSTAQSLTTPSHPYAMYQQNTLPVADDDDDDSTAESLPAIPVGFPGRNAGFHRQVGPDGEEQDIIGPDGHTEQLPPYTQYPDANEKVWAARAASTPTLAPESQTTLVSLPADAQQPDADRLSRPDASSEPTPAPSEKSWAEKNWKEKRKTKICGIPFWLLLVGFGCLVFVSVVIGGVIGGFLTHQRHEKYAHPAQTPHHHRHQNVTNPTSRSSHHSNQNGNTASTIDASAIPSPTGLPPFPTGLFVLPLGDPQETEPSCLTDSDQLATWSCNVVSPPLIIDTETAAGGAAIAQLYPAQLPPGVQKYQYGPQPPMVPAQKLSFVDDIEYSQLGPALHFQTVYDKLVILDPGSLTAPSSNKKRQESTPAPTDSFGDFEPSATSRSRPSGAPYPSPYGGHGFPGGNTWHRKNTVQAGDQPWFCFWNSTFIETFIYLTQAISMNDSDGSSASSTRANNAGAAATSTGGNNDGQGQGSSTPSSTTFVTSTALPSDNTATPIRAGLTYAGTSPSSVSIHAQRLARDGKFHIKDSDDTDQFPFIVKVSERRLRHPPVQPYCQKMSINSDGSVTTFYQNGQQVVVKLSEQDPSDAAFASAAASPLPQSTATGSAATVASTSNRMARRAAAAGVKRVSEDWRTAEEEEEAVEARLADWADREWDLLDEVLWKREDPAKSCVCQWLVV